MGVNCTAYLSPKATWEYVGMVASRLLGSEASKEALGDSFHAVIKGFDHHSFKPVGSPEYIYITVNGDVTNPVAKAIQDSDQLPYAMWYGLESRYLGPKATAAKIALTRAIVKFFGGTFTPNDSLDEVQTFGTPPWIGADDGKLWERLHQEIIDLKPLTQEDIDGCKPWAAY